MIRLFAQPFCCHFTFYIAIEKLLKKRKGVRKMIEIKKYEIEELKILATLVEDEKTKEQLNNVYEVLKNKKKYVTKFTKLELEYLGFKINTTYLTSDRNYIMNILSGEVDIVNGKVLRIGLGRIDKFNPRWYELELNKRIE